MARNSSGLRTVHLGLNDKELDVFIERYSAKNDLSWRGEPSLSVVLRTLILQANETLAKPANLTLNMDHVRVNIKRLRREARLTQQELADLAGVSLSTISHTEKARTTPPARTLEAIAGAFSQVMAREVTVEELAAEPEN